MFQFGMVMDMIHIEATTRTTDTVAHASPPRSSRPRASRPRALRGLARFAAARFAAARFAAARPAQRGGDGLGEYFEVRAQIVSLSNFMHHAGMH
jgi:hypothetical protein